MKAVTMGCSDCIWASLVEGVMYHIASFVDRQLSTVLGDISIGSNQHQIGRLSVSTCIPANATYFDKRKMHPKWVHPIVVRKDGVAHRDMPSRSFAKAHLAPISETSSHVLLQPLSFFMLVVKLRYTWHSDGTLAITSPYSLERIVVQILFVGVAARRRLWLEWAVQVQSSGLILGYCDSSRHFL